MVAAGGEDDEGPARAAPLPPSPRRRRRGPLEALSRWPRGLRGGGEAAELELTVEEARQAEAETEHLRNVLHDARSAVAGIECATSTLRAYGSSLSTESRAELEEAVAAELVRLRNLLAPVGASDVGPAARLLPVDDALRPLVVAHRERGQRVDWSPCGLDVLVDGHVVATVVANLLDNALVHAPGAKVRIDVGLDGGTADHGGDPGESRLEVVVRDHGSGVRARFAGSLFVPGARGAVAGPGEGRGLAHARRVARQHGGEVALAASDGGGTAFSLRLPVVVGSVPLGLARPDGGS